MKEEKEREAEGGEGESLSDNGAKWFWKGRDMKRRLMKAPWILFPLVPLFSSPSYIK